MIRVLYFGKLADAVGCSEEVLDLPEGVECAAGLRAWLDGARGCDGALLAPGVRLAVNQEIATDQTTLAGEEEIAFLPPVSGG